MPTKSASPKPNRPKKCELENHFRDHLSGTPRRISKESARLLAAQIGADSKQSDRTFQDLIDADLLVRVPGTDSYEWEALLPARTVCT